MRISILREFVELAHWCNFTKAADRIHISQPALSNHIAELERECGTKLITRTKPIALTAAGRIMYENACTIITAYDDACTRCAEVGSNDTTGILKIKRPALYGEDARGFTSILLGFQKENPSSDFRFIHQGNECGTLIEEMLLGNIDLGVFYTINPAPIIINKHACIQFICLGTYNICCWMSPTHPLAAQDAVAWNDLEGIAYPLPAGVQFDEIRRSAFVECSSFGVKPNFRYIMADRFEDYLFRIREDEIILIGDPSQSNPYKEFMPSRIFKPMYPAFTSGIFLAVRVDEREPVTSQFFKYLKAHYGNQSDQLLRSVSEVSISLCELS